MKKWIEKLKKKDGWVTLLIIFVLSTMLPIFLFFFVEMNYLYGVKDKAQYIADDISSSAVRSVDATKLTSGVVAIDEVEAKDVATSVFIKNYDLNDDLSIKGKSMLRENPTLKVYVINPTTNTGESFTTDEGYTYTIYQPSVIVYTSIKPKGVFFNRLVNIQTLSMHVIKSQTTQQTAPTTTPTDTTTPIVIQYTIPAPDLSYIPDQGTFTGKKTITVNGVTVYDGKLSNGKFDAKGKLYDQSGKLIYDGSWTNGVYDSSGTVYNPDGSTFYQGNITNGVPNGQGSYYGTDGVLDYQGQFDNGYVTGKGSSSSNSNNPKGTINAIVLLFEKVYFEK
jgi:hypothetical protein